MQRERGENYPHSHTHPRHMRYEHTSCVTRQLGVCAEKGVDRYREECGVIELEDYRERDCRTGYAREYYRVVCVNIG